MCKVDKSGIEIDDRNVNCNDANLWLMKYTIDDNASGRLTTAKQYLHGRAPVSITNENEWWNLPHMSTIMSSVARRKDLFGKNHIGKLPGWGTRLTHKLLILEILAMNKTHWRLPTDISLPIIFSAAGLREAIPLCATAKNANMYVIVSVVSPPARLSMIILNWSPSIGPWSYIHM